MSRLIPMIREQMCFRSHAASRDWDQKAHPRSQDKTSINPMLSKGSNGKNLHSAHIPEDSFLQCADLINFPRSRNMQKWFLTYIRTVKVWANPRIWTGWPEPSLFAHRVCRLRRSLWQRARDLGQVNDWACTFDWVELKYTLNTSFAWCGLYVYWTKSYISLCILGV